MTAFKDKESQESLDSLRKREKLNECLSLQTKKNNEGKYERGVNVLYDVVMHNMQLELKKQGFR